MSKALGIYLAVVATVGALGGFATIAAWLSAAKATAAAKKKS